MKKAQVIYQNGDHLWRVIARDPEKPDYLIDTNEYVISHENRMLITDPGGVEIFPAVFSALAEACDPNQLQSIFASHQDPDIISSLALWLAFKPDLKCYLSWLWSTFIPHFGGDGTTFVLLPDEGLPLSLGKLSLQAIPAHYLHSSGNFHLYDPEARVLFTGDVGAALLPAEAGIWVTDFDKHIEFAQGFHRRWMGSPHAKRTWCERVGRLKIDMLCPQHGAIYKGADVERFINWFDELEIGVLKG